MIKLKWSGGVKKISITNINDKIHNNFDSIGGSTEKVNKIPFEVKFK